QALRDVSFEVASGELVALTGASGSGKSTLLNLVGALDKPDAGTIRVDGQRLDELERPAEYRAAMIGFVFQAHNLLPTLTASENVQVAMFGRAPRHARDARSRARSPTSRGFCSRTSRRARSIPRPAARCSTCSSSSAPSTG